MSKTNYKIVVKAELLFSDYKKTYQQINIKIYLKVYSNLIHSKFQEIIYGRL